MPREGILMKNVVKFLMVLTAISLFITGCEKGSDSWPPNVKDTLFVPDKQEYIKYYKLEGTYQVIYKANICWPAEEFINSTVEHMSKRGWRRLEEDFMNPGLKHNWTREKFRQWSFFLDQKGMDVHQWMDDWEDKDKNIVRYGFRYITKRENNTSITSRTCNLDAVVIYMPYDVRPSPADLDAMKKQGDAEIERLKREHK
jgi:hypothetical protein